MAGESDNGAVSKWPVIDLIFRNALAITVVGSSVAGIVFVVKIIDVTDANDKRLVFSTLIPVFATWVGTILAFYFSRENFKAASDAVNKIAEKLTPEQKLAQTAAKDRMKSRSAITVRQLTEGEDESKILISDLMKIIEGGASRVLIFTPKDAAKYVIHESTLNKYIANVASAAAANNTAANALASSLKDFLGYKINDVPMSDIVKRFAFVKEDATLADARAAMVASKGFEDVFVTKGGRPEEPVLGWLTNSDITREL